MCKELFLGEGSVRTLAKHLKAEGIKESTKVGTTTTSKGKRVSKQLLSSIPAEMSLSRCSVALGKFNYAVLLKQYGFALKSGIYAAIRMGAIGATSQSRAVSTIKPVLLSCLVYLISGLAIE